MTTIWVSDEEYVEEETAPVGPPQEPPADAETGAGLDDEPEE